MNNEIKFIDLLAKKNYKVPCGTWQDPKTGIKYVGEYIHYKTDMPRLANLESISVNAYISKCVHTRMIVDKDEELFQKLLVEKEGYAFDGELFDKAGFIPGHLYEIRKLYDYDIPIQVIYTADNKFIQIEEEVRICYAEDDWDNRPLECFVYSPKELVHLVCRMKNSDLENIYMIDTTIYKHNEINVNRRNIPILNKIVPTKDRPEIGIEIIKDLDNDGFHCKCNVYLKDKNGNWQQLEDMHPIVPYFEFRQTILENYSDLFEMGPITSFDPNIECKSFAMYMDNELKVVIAEGDYCYHIFDPKAGTEDVINSDQLDNYIGGKTINRIRWWKE